MGGFSVKTFKKRSKEISARKKRSAEKRSKRFVRTLKAETGKNLMRFKETTSDAEFPWEDMGIHYSCGSDGETHIRCLRDHVDKDKPGYQPVSKCPECKQVEIGLKKARGDKRAKISFLKKRRNQRVLLEGICLTPLLKFFDEDRKLPKPKKCFGTFAWADDDDRFSGCEKCVKKTSWGKVCESGIGYMSVGPKLSDPLTTQAIDIGKSLGNNPFSLKKGHNFKFTKSGERLKTDYSDVGFDLKPFVLPEVVRKYMEENSLDWSTIYPKLSFDETKARMEGSELIEDIEDGEDIEEGEEEEGDEDEDDEDDEDEDDEDEDDEDDEDEDDEDEEEGEEDDDEDEEGEEEEDDEDEEGEDEDEEGEDDEEGEEEEDEDGEEFFEDIEKELSGGEEEEKLSKGLKKQSSKKKKAGTAKKTKPKKKKKKK